MKEAKKKLIILYPDWKFYKAYNSGPWNNGSPNKNLS